LKPGHFFFQILVSLTILYLSYKGMAPILGHAVYLQINFLTMFYCTLCIVWEREIGTLASSLAMGLG
jgi:hypothetical protein